MLWFGREICSELEKPLVGTIVMVQLKSKYMKMSVLYTLAIGFILHAVLILIELPVTC